MSNTSAADFPAVLLAATETPVVIIPPGVQIGSCVIRFVNLDSVPRNLTVYDYNPSGSPYAAETAGPTTTLVPNVTVPPRSFIEVGPLVLPPGRKISGFGDVANVFNARLHGFKTA